MSDMRFDRCGGRRPDGPRADAPSFRKPPGAVVTGAPGRRPVSETVGQGCRACWPALPANGVLLSRRSVVAVGQTADGYFGLHGAGREPSPMSRSPAERGLVHVIGTTGLSASDMAVIKTVTSPRPSSCSPANMSLGVNLLAAPGQSAWRRRWTRSFDIEILEMHPQGQDRTRPSGTALLLGEAARRRAARSRWISIRRRRGAMASPAHGDAGAIGFASLRGRHRDRRSQRDLRRPDGTHRTDAPGRGPHHVCAKAPSRPPRCGRATRKPGFLYDDRRCSG